MAEYWLKIDYKGEDTGKVLTSVYDKVFHNKLDSIQEITITPCEKTIIIYADRGLDKILDNIDYKDTTLDLADLGIFLDELTDNTITSIKVGIVGE